MISLKKLLIETVISLDELRVRGKKTGDRDTILAVRDSVWIINDEHDGEIPEEFQKEIGEKFGFKFPDHPYTIQDVEDRLDDRPHPPSAVIGYINKNKLILSPVLYPQYDPQSSIFLKKIVNQLKLSGVEYYTAHDDIYSTPKKKMKGVIPDIVYHGTSSSYLDTLLRYGLMPAKRPSNYPQLVHHDDLVFFSSLFDEAQHHAEYASSRQGIYGKPVIIEMLIPDKSKLTPDWDIAREYGGQGEKISSQTSKEKGLWGYKGRIPASNFKFIYAAFKFSKENPYLKKEDYKKLSIAKAKKYLEQGYFDL
jgi:hypothetical protein